MKAVNAKTWQNRPIVPAGVELVLAAINDLGREPDYLAANLWATQAGIQDFYSFWAQLKRTAAQLEAG